MTKKRIVIRGAEVTGFSDEVSFTGLTLSAFSKKRVSHIVPANPFLRLVFKALRKCTSDTSFIAAWSRRWPCQWLVFVDNKSYGPFSNRLHAISFEKDLVYSQGKLHSSNVQVAA